MVRIALVAVGLAAGCTFQVDEPLQERADRSRPFAPADDAVPDELAADEPADELDETKPTDPVAEPTDPVDEERAPWDPSRPFVEVRGDRFTGSLGVMNDFDLPTDLAFVYDDGWYSYVEVYALRSDGERVMLSLGATGDASAPFFFPGMGYRFRPGFARGFYTDGLACQGPDSGVQAQGMAFADTPTDEEPCDTAVEAEEDPNEPGVLHVTLAATLGDDCDEGEDSGGDGEDLPDADGDGDGDIPPPAPPGESNPSDPNDDRHPLTVTASFDLVQG